MKRTPTLTALLALVAATLLGPAWATSRDTVSEEQLVDRAELIFRGTVVDVQHRTSDVEGPNDLALPHTFVTFRIDETLKGRSEMGRHVTLRLLGGPTGEGTYMLVSGVPLFDVGDQDVLFVEGNGRLSCPLVGMDQGRFRLIDDRVYTDGGREVELRADGRIAAGKRRDLEPVVTHRLGDLDIRIESVEPDQERGGRPASPGPPEQGAVRAGRFLGELARKVAARHDARRLRDLPAVASPHVDEPFTIKNQVVAGPPVPRASTPPAIQGEPDPREARLQAEDR